MVGFEQIGCLVDGFFLGIVGQFVESGVDFDDVILWVGDYDVFMGIVEDVGCQFLLFFGDQVFVDIL